MLQTSLHDRGSVTDQKESQIINYIRVLIIDCDRRPEGFTGLKCQSVMRALREPQKDNSRDTRTQAGNKGTRRAAHLEWVSGARVFTCIPAGKGKMLA